MVVNSDDAEGIDSGDNPDPVNSTLTSGPSQQFEIVPVRVSLVDAVTTV